MNTGTSLDSLRNSRVKRLCAAYFGITVGIGLVLPPGEQLGALRGLLQGFVGRLDGVMQVASRSFDPGFVEVFCALSLLTAFALAIVSCFWIPSGSHKKTFPNTKTKVLFLLAGLLCFGLSLEITTVTHSSQGLGGGRTAAMLYLGSSTKSGVLTILNVWFGFAQLFFFVAFRAGATTPIQRTH